jgi:DNA-directed RNA polymerase specialized sigma24 family protein
MSAKSDTPAEFVSLIHQHQAIVHRICRVYATDVHDRDDLYQEIVMQAWQAFHSFRRQGQVFHLAVSSGAQYGIVAESQAP